jgi:hypothetical protein
MHTARDPKWTTTSIATYDGMETQYYDREIVRMRGVRPVRLAGCSAEGEPCVPGCRVVLRRLLVCGKLATPPSGTNTLRIMFALRKRDIYRVKASNNLP